MAVVAGIIVGLGAAFLGSVWAAKEFRRQNRLALYGAFIEAFLAVPQGPPGPAPSSPVRAAFDLAYLRVRLIGSKRARTAAKALRDKVSAAEADREAAVQHFCDAARPSIINWRPN